MWAWLGKCWPFVWLVGPWIPNKTNLCSCVWSLVLWWCMYVVTSLWMGGVIYGPWNRYWDYYTNHLRTKPYWIACMLVLRLCGSFGNRGVYWCYYSPLEPHCLESYALCIWMHMWCGQMNVNLSGKGCPNLGLKVPYIPNTPTPMFFEWNWVFDASPCALWPCLKLMCHLNLKCQTKCSCGHIWVLRCL